MLHATRTGLRVEGPPAWMVLEGAEASGLQPVEGGVADVVVAKVELSQSRAALCLHHARECGHAPVRHAHAPQVQLPQLGAGALLQAQAQHGHARIPHAPVVREQQRSQSCPAAPGQRVAEVQQGRSVQAAAR